ncbi:MAG: hypothetical protein AB7O67_23220 [Vicinamibacterales bacterium]
MSFRRRLIALALVLWPVAAAAQITPTYTFTAGTVISPDEVNANFALLGSALNRTDGIVTSTITVPNTGLHLLDTDASHDLIVAPGSNLTADHTLTVTTGDADRTVTIGGDATISQDYSTSGTPSFAGLTVTGTGATAIDVAGGINAGSGNVGIVGTDGRVPAISSTYFASLDGSALTNLTSATYAVAAKTTTYTVTTSDNVLTASGTFTITLYAASGNTGRLLEIKNIGTGTVTIDGNASETIDGETTYVLEQQYESVTLLCTGSGWVIL